MLDPGRYFAEAIYFLQYVLAQILWAIARATLSIAIIAESLNSWVTANVGYFVELLANALSAPLGGMFILALTALGFWYALNNVVPTNRWVDPGKLFTYGLIAFFFFSSPIVVIDMMEDLRQSLNAGIDQALIDGAAGDIFATNMDGTDPGLPGAIGDVNSDGVIGSFDLVAAFMLVANLDELDSSEFPVDFEATFFPFGDPTGINLADEADQQLAKALASQGIERLLFALVAIPTAIAEHFLRLALTGVAMFLYAGVPFALLFAFFIYTQAFLGAYLRQFINLLIETLMSVIIVSIMIGLLAAAAQQGIGLYIGASIITLIVILWRIKSAMKLGTAAFNLFGGAMLSGGSGGMELANMGKQAVMGTVGLAGAALTGGATLAAGGAALASVAALQADGRADGAYLGTDPHKTEGRVRQLKTIAGYTLGKSETARHVIEGAHETRTLVRNFRDGQVQAHEPDILDYLRAGSSMSGFGSSPWLAMRTSPSLRTAFDQIGGSRPSDRDAVFDGDGEPVDLPGDDAGLPAGSAAPPARPQARISRRSQTGDWPAQTPHRSEDVAEATRRLSWQSQAAADPSQLATSVNGPIPDWLRQETVTAPGALVSGRAPAAEATPLADETGAPLSPVPGFIRLHPYQPARRQVIHDTLQRLTEPDSPARQAAYETLRLYTGEDNTRQILYAIQQHTVTAVQEATAATAGLVAQYRQQGMPDAEQLAAFQSGQALAVLRETVGTPLSDVQLAAVADMVLLPQRYLTRAELAAVIGQEAAAPNATEQAVIQAIGSPVGLGGMTGSVRGVLAGAQAMNLSPAELARLAELIQDGLRDVVQAELAGRGYRPEMVRDFVSDMAALPGALVVPQTAASRPVIMASVESEGR